MTKDEKIAKLGKEITDRATVLLGKDKITPDAPEYLGINSALKFTAVKYDEKMADDILDIARVVQPHAIPRDADENRAKPVARKLRDDVVCRFERYIVFGGNAAEDDRNVDHEAPSSAHAARRRTE